MVTRTCNNCASTLLYGETQPACYTCKYHYGQDSREGLVLRSKWRKPPISHIIRNVEELYEKADEIGGSPYILEFVLDYLKAIENKDLVSKRERTRLFENEELDMIQAALQSYVDFDQSRADDKEYIDMHDRIAERYRDITIEFTGAAVAREEIEKIIKLK